MFISLGEEILIYFIADTHFSEENIILYENRPFKDAAEMDSTLLERWNQVILKEDEVYVLGDFGAQDKESFIVSQLKGRKFLVKGNHDTKSNSYYRDCGFEEVYDYPIILKNFWIGAGEIAQKLRMLIALPEDQELDFHPHMTHKCL